MSGSGAAPAGAKTGRLRTLSIPTTPAMAVARLVEDFGRDPVESLGHPKYYNIAWMELLERARPAFQAMQNIFEPVE